MNSSGMNISEYHILVMNMANTIAQLSKNGDCLVQVEGTFAEALPRGDVVRGLTGKL